MKRHLIVNADDFGQSAGVNRGVIEAYERGIVTSASLMVRWPAAREAAAYVRGHSSLSLGLHFDFGEWRYCDGRWCKLYEVVPEEDARAVREESLRQLASFRRLTKMDPTHLDSHQHLHHRRALELLFVKLARELNVPLRNYEPRILYYGGFYGQDGIANSLPDLIQPDALINALQGLPEGFTELGCHPGYAGDLNTMYRDERATEVETLCEPGIRSALASNGIELCSFDDFALAGNAGFQ